jgi:hypothetical protein
MLGVPVAAFLFAVPAFAETLTHPVAKVKVEVPADWKTAIHGNTLKLTDKSGDITATFVVVDAGAAANSKQAAEKSLKAKIKQLKTTKEEKVTINGMGGSVVEGDGRLAGKDIDWAVFVLDTPNDEKDLLIVTVAEDAKLAAHKAELRALFERIQPAP